MTVHHAGDRIRTVYLVINKETDVVTTTRVFASALLAWNAIDAMASWIATPEELRKQFDVIPIEVEEE